jgi:hypothetical protein
MTDNVISLDSRRPNPWQADADCECAACHIRNMGRDLDDRLRHAGDLLSLDARDAMRHYLQQLAELCGVECQYEPAQVQ